MIGIQTQNGPFFDCTFSWTRNTLFFFQDVVYDRNTYRSVPNNLFSDFFSKFDDLPQSRFLLRLLQGNFFLLNFFTSSVLLSPAPTIVLICCEAISLVLHICMAFFKSRDFSLKNLTLSPWFFKPMTSLPLISLSVSAPYSQDAANFLRRVI